MCMTIVCLCTTVKLVLEKLSEECCSNDRTSVEKQTKKTKVILLYCESWPYQELSIGIVKTKLKISTGSVKKKVAWVHRKL